MGICDKDADGWQYGVFVMGCVGFSLICTTRSMKYNVQAEALLSVKAIAPPFYPLF